MLIIIKNSLTSRLINEYEGENNNTLPLTKSYLDGRIDMIKELEANGVLRVI